LEPRRRDTRTPTLSSPASGGGKRGGIAGSATGRALVIEPVVRRVAARATPSDRAPAARLDEAVGLARAIDLDVAQAGMHAAIGNRSWSSDPSRVAAFGRAVAQEMLAGGVAPVLRHLRVGQFDDGGQRYAGLAAL